MDFIFIIITKRRVQFPEFRGVWRHQGKEQLNCNKSKLTVERSIWILDVTGSEEWKPFTIGPNENLFQKQSSSRK